MKKVKTAVFTISIIILSLIVIKKLIYTYQAKDSKNKVKPGPDFVDRVLSNTDRPKSDLRN